ncbi:phage major capsid protein, HK97 family [Polaromonas sp. OV174]|uniref:phage major capsid protein n=1 Tax=Polaromonas sp. OV174 TaxID=1855300 RepID=UPI0008E37EAF|nr:phage major capsid protein [Polaromonas sp. OV174]SFB74236.1 phage major capsid protein, HK97 family [Polaromonas sp. OV174]
MQFTRKNLTLGLLAIVAVLALFAVAGHPLIAPEALAGLGMIPMAMGGEVTLLEVKKVLEDQGKAFEEFKTANDALIKAKAEGKALGDLESKVSKLGEALDKFDELKTAIEDIQKKANRPQTDSEVKAAAELTAEVKSFNLMLRADFQSKGKAAPAEVDAKGYTEYKNAFFKMMTGTPMNSLSSDEQKAMSAGSDPDGGYLLPPSTVGRMVSKVYEQSTMRQLANVQTISTDKLEGIVDNGEADAGWVSELGDRNDTNTPQVGKYEIGAHEMYAQPKASQKILDDAATDVEGWLAGKVADKFARVEGAGFTTGDGVGKPRGLFAYPTAATGDDTRAWGTFEHVVTGASGTFHTNKADPLQDMIGAFKDRYLQNATWLMRREARTAVRKMKEATSDRYLWEPSLQAGQPDRLLGYPARVDQYVPAMGAGSLSLAFGDIREAYTIVDRMGIRTLRDPYTAKPYVKFYSTKRTGGGAVNFEAVKFLKFST